MYNRFILEQVDGFCECANCSKLIRRKQWYDRLTDEFLCTDCKQIAEEKDSEDDQKYF